jgi:glycosyltransferase involved in cell wall biosynthesis
VRRASLRILITNNTLGRRYGSELYVRDLALALMRRGHFPVVYSTVLGDVAAELREATVPVVDDLRALNTPPDVIHGHHHLDAMTAMLQFPEVPAIYVCHGWLPWEELPPVFPSIRRYVAVDDLCRERLLTSGIATEQIDMLYNFVDMDRFRPRDPLPAVPRSALIFSNSATDGSFGATIREACQAFGIERIDVAGLASGHAITQPEQELGGYDIVFGKARCALEAMAVGCATVVADFAGLAGMVDTGNMQQMRRLNFGVRTMQAGAITRDSVLTALRAYNPADARQVAEWIRSEADMCAAVDRLLVIYDLAINAPPAAEGEQLSRAALADASAYLRSLAPVIKGRHEAEKRAQQAGEALRVAESRSLRIAGELAGLQASRAWRALGGYRKLRAWLGL